MKRIQKPTERACHQQGNALSPSETNRLGNQFAHYHVEGAQEYKSAGERDSVSNERGMRSRSSRPDRLECFGERRFPKSTDGQARQSDSKLDAGDDAVQIAKQNFHNPRPRVTLGYELAHARQPDGHE